MHYYLCNIIWQYLEITDLIRLFQLNKTFVQLGKDENTWQFLLSRDFNINRINKNPRKKYFQMLLRDYADIVNRYARFYYDVSEDPILESYDRRTQIHALLKDEAVEHKTYAISALGFNETPNQKYGIFCGNKIGCVFWQYLKSTCDLLFDNEQYDVTIVDALIYEILTIKYMMKTKQTGYAGVDNLINKTN